MSSRRKNGECVMENVVRTEPWGRVTPLYSADCCASQRSDGCLRMAAVALALSALMAPAAPIRPR
jgi:hypothetical protein